MVSATVVPSLQSPRLDSVLSRLFHLGVLPQALEKWLPKALWAEINLLFVGFGQQVSCRDGGVARNALCLTFVYRFAAQSTPTVRRASTARFVLSAARHCAPQRMLPGTSSRGELRGDPHCIPPSSNFCSSSNHHFCRTTGTGVRRAANHTSAHSSPRSPPSINLLCLFNMKLIVAVVVLACVVAAQANYATPALNHCNMLKNATSCDAQAGECVWCKCAAIPSGCFTPVRTPSRQF